MCRRKKVAPEAIALLPALGGDAQIRQENQRRTGSLDNAVVQEVEECTAKAQRVTTIKLALADRAYRIDSSAVADKMRKDCAQVRVDMALLEEMVSQINSAPLSAEPENSLLLSPRGKDVTD
jgi:hypothetical protein